MDVDIILEPDLTPSQICELGQAAEQYGIRALWTSNYFAHWDAVRLRGIIGISISNTCQNQRVLQGSLNNLCNSGADW